MMEPRNCATCQVSEDDQFNECQKCTGPNWPNWKGKVEHDPDPLRAEIDALKVKLALYENLTTEYGLSMFADISEALKEAQDINALKDKWYRRGIAGFQDYERGHNRYEKLRKLSPREYETLWRKHFYEDVLFDDLVDALP